MRATASIHFLFRVHREQAPVRVRTASAASRHYGRAVKPAMFGQLIGSTLGPVATLLPFLHGTAVLLEALGRLVAQATGG